MMFVADNFSQMAKNIFVDIVCFLNKLVKNDAIALKHFEHHFPYLHSMAFSTGLGIYFVDQEDSTLFHCPL
jgi:hypothetical protein